MYSSVTTWTRHPFFVCQAKDSVHIVTEGWVNQGTDVVERMEVARGWCPALKLALSLEAMLGQLGTGPLHKTDRRGPSVKAPSVRGLSVSFMDLLQFLELASHPFPCISKTVVVGMYCTLDPLRVYLDRVRRVHHHLLSAGRIRFLCQFRCPSTTKSAILTRMRKMTSWSSWASLVFHKDIDKKRRYTQGTLLWKVYNYFVENISPQC